MQIWLKTTAFGMSFNCFRYVFSVAIISALALVKYANLRLTYWSKNRLGISPRCAAIYGMHITPLHFVVLHTFL